MFIHFLSVCFSKYILNFSNLFSLEFNLTIIFFYFFFLLLCIMKTFFDSIIQITILFFSYVHLSSFFFFNFIKKSFFFKIFGQVSVKVTYSYIFLLFRSPDLLVLWTSFSLYNSVSFLQRLKNPCLLIFVFGVSIHLPLLFPQVSLWRSCGRGQMCFWEGCAVCLSLPLDTAAPIRAGTMLCHEEPLSTLCFSPWANSFAVCCSVQIRKGRGTY